MLNPLDAPSDNFGGGLGKSFLDEHERLDRKVECEQVIADGVEKAPEADSNSCAGERSCEEAGERLARCKRKAKEGDEGDERNGSRQRWGVAAPEATNSGRRGISPGETAKGASDGGMTKSG